MDFLIEAQLPPALVNWLIERGHTASHVADLAQINATDLQIWDHAFRTNSIVLTKDEDFSDRVSRTTTGPTIVWLRIGNATTRSLVEWLEPRWPSIIQLIGESNRLIEVR